MPRDARPMQPARTSINAAPNAGKPTPMLAELDSGKTLVKVVDMIIAEIEARGLHDEGIYRVSGGYTSTRGLKTRLLGPTAESKEDIIKAVENVHDLTSAFKVMLRELSPPLFTYEAYDKFKGAIMQHEGAARNEALAAGLRGLAAERLTMIAAIATHLRTVASNAAENKMHSRNLALIFGPTLIRSPKGVVDDLRDATVQAEIILEILDAPAESPIDKTLAASSTLQAGRALQRRGSLPKRREQAVKAAVGSIVNETTISNEDAFQLFDLDGNGTIDMKELGLVLRAQGHMISRKELKELFKAIDVDGNGVIDEHEFQLAATHRVLQDELDGHTPLDTFAKAQACTAAFATFDKGGTGELTKTELEFICRFFGEGESLSQSEVAQLMEDLDMGQGSGKTAFDFNSFVAALSPEMHGASRHIFQ